MGGVTNEYDIKINNILNTINKVLEQMDVVLKS